MTILAEILKAKEKEVVTLKEKSITFSSTSSQKSLYESFVKSSTLNVIAEIKRASPSKGDIKTDIDPVEQAKAYVAAGADAISVLTDSAFFKGSMEDLRNVREAVDVPILCKDFIIDRVQIDRAKANGADVILLIAAALPKEKLSELYDYALTNNLEVLFEVHNEAELDVALEIGANIIGINNRDLKTFQVDLQVTEKLANKVPLGEKLLISESGFHREADARRAVGAGAKGILVGEALMQAENIENTLKSLKLPVGEKG